MTYVRKYFYGISDTPFKKKKKPFYQANMSSAEKSDRNRTYYYGIAKKRLNVAMRTIASLSTTKT